MPQSELSPELPFEDREGQARRNTKLLAVTPEQCRAARGWLDWTQSDLAFLSQVGFSTIKMFESGKGRPNPSTAALIRQIFEQAGIEFELDAEGIALGMSVNLTHKFDVALREERSRRYKKSIGTYGPREL
jgi:transcriptional regulator with XRE-family HTH domain